MVEKQQKPFNDFKMARYPGPAYHTRRLETRHNSFPRKRYVRSVDRRTNNSKMSALFLCLDDSDDD